MFRERKAKEPTDQLFVRAPLSLNNRYKTHCNETGLSYGELLEDLMKRAGIRSAPTCPTNAAAIERPFSCSLDLHGRCQCAGRTNRPRGREPIRAGQGSCITAAQPVMRALFATGAVQCQ